MILRWANTLSGRLTISIFLALLAAQVMGIMLFVKSNERDRSERVTEGFIRQVSALTDLYNSASVIDRENFLKGIRQPGLQFWTGSIPAVTARQSDLSPDAPTVSAYWERVKSSDKRIEWFPDDRPLLVRYSIAPEPLLRNIPNVDRGPPRKRPDKESDSASPNLRFPGFFDPAHHPPPQDGDTFEKSRRPPRNDMRPPPPPPDPVQHAVRWRVSVLLDNGEWLNAEHLYELGLPPWLTTVLFQNGVILAIMLLLVVPVIAFATRRLTQLSQAADNVGRGEDTPALPESGATEIRHLTQAFNNMSLRLRRYVQGRTQMLAGISHDLRTPITALRLRAELVDDDENRERMLALIDDMHHLTEATLTLAREDSFTEKSDKVDLSSMIEGICDDLSDAGVEVTADVARGVSLICHPYSLRRAIRNLVENGTKYGKRARIKILDAPKNISIVIDDDGPGIPSDQIEKAFQPFVRLEGSRSRKTGGSGLGLAIARSIVLNHGGNITLANRPEGGLRATITLPKPEML